LSNVTSGQRCRVEHLVDQGFMRQLAARDACAQGGNGEVVAVHHATTGSACTA
jgi:hypothetical protein